MKKHFKFIGVFLCALLIGTSFIFSKSSNNKVYADDNSEVGTANLNNTADNSAKVGDQLLHPEIGWQRIDDSDSKILKTNMLYGNDYPSQYYNGSGYYGTSSLSTATFKFYGTMLRLVMQKFPNRSPLVNIKIDGNKEVYSGYASTQITSVIVYEKTNLSLSVHTVTITCPTATTSSIFMIDAFDIDSTGYLVDPSATLATGISLDKTSLDMKTGDTSNLKATVAPDNATNKTVKWTSSDPSIATVDANGKITAVKEGSVTITATAKDGSNKTATCTVNVKNPADGNALLTVTMTDGQQRTYDIKMSQINDFITWYNNRANGQGNFTYSFNKTPSSAAYTKRTEYLVYDKISNYDVDEYKAQN